MASTVLEPEIAGPESVHSGRWMTVIFNNETTPQDAVVMVLMLATGCDVDEAYMEMWEAEQFGKAPCHFGTQAVCEEAARIIGGVGVKTEVVPEWEDA